VRKISFTGSVRRSASISPSSPPGDEARHHGARRAFAGDRIPGDADPEKSADTIAASVPQCRPGLHLADVRFYVQEAIYDRFLKRFTDNAKAIKLGDGLEKDTTMGPLANPRRLDAMDLFVADAKSRGGKVVAGGSRSGKSGLLRADRDPPTCRTTARS
jgi:succinate-semialdehyde dehydrogenase/glutarate-semialdehyde dehydrogenase